MLRRNAVLALTVIAIAGCATQSAVPDGYAGPTAQLGDSALVHSSSKADFFVVDSINGIGVTNSIGETERRNYGRGKNMTPYFINRPLVAETPVKLVVRARTHYGAPILELTNTVFQVKGVVEFTPKANGRYIVRGELGESYSAVWVEDASSNQVAGQKVEVKGSAKLGFLEK